MKAIVLEQPGDLKLRDVSAPGPAGPARALVRVKRVGICGTDLHAYGGNQNFFSYPRIMGHELAVEVIDIGATDSQLDYAVGDLCCVIPYLNCGDCIACRRGKSNCCTQMQVLGVHIDGGMREQFSCLSTSCSRPMASRSSTWRWWKCSASARMRRSAPASAQVRMRS